MRATTTFTQTTSCILFMFLCSFGADRSISFCVRGYSFLRLKHRTIFDKTTMKNGRSNNSSLSSTSLALSPLSSSRNEKLSSSPSPPPPPLSPIKLFPAHLFEELKSKYGSRSQTVKLIHMIRHAEGTHNVNKEYKLEVNMDAPLTKKGIQQCLELSQSQQVQRILEQSKTNNNDDIAIVTSSMTRCIQTVVHSFPDLLSSSSTDGDDGDDIPKRKIPFVAHESFRETVNYNCDRRRSLSDLKKEFGGKSYGLDFSLLGDSEDDPIWDYWRQRLPDDWDKHMESAQLHKVVERAWDGLLYLACHRKESQIVICSHSAFLRCIFNWNQRGGVPQLVPQDSLDDHLVKDDKMNEGDGTDGTTRTGYSSSCRTQSFNTGTKNRKVFKYYHEMPSNEDGSNNDDDSSKDTSALKEFEESMRPNYENAELRSFVLVFDDTHHQYYNHHVKLQKQQQQ